MKVQNFYPRQVLRRLVGEHRELDAGQRAAIKYAGLKGRKLGLSISVGSTATASEVLAAASPEFAQAVIANATTRIIINQAA